MLELKNICYKVKADKAKGAPEKQILKDINLKLEDGKFYVVTGPNGSGKSTLAKLIMGIISPTSGKILFDGKDITKLSITERANLGIGFAFQQPVKFKGLTVLDLIGISAGKKISVSEACEELSRDGLCARDYVDRVVDDSLSGGELKRIEIAMLEARGAKLSIFDEPEAGIDLWSFGNLIKTFERIREQNKKSISLIISHQQRLIEIADEVILLNAGEIESIAPPSNLGAKLGAGYCTKLKGEN